MHIHRQGRRFAWLAKAVRAALLLVISPITVAALLAALVAVDAQAGWGGDLPLAQVCIKAQLLHVL
jgi:hypothetical protein